MRARILGWYVVLLVLAMAIAIAGSRNVQLTSLDKHLDRVLDHEVQDLRLLAEGGTDPATGRPFTGVRQLFLAQLGRRAPPRNEIMVTFVDGRPFLRSADPPPARLAPTPA